MDAPDSSFAMRFKEYIQKQPTFLLRARVCVCVCVCVCVIFPLIPIPPIRRNDGLIYGSLCLSLACLIVNWHISRFISIETPCMEIFSKNGRA